MILSLPTRVTIKHGKQNQMNKQALLKVHQETCRQALAIMDVKNNDYSGGEHAHDALANFKASESLGLHPITGLLLRMQDKLQRLRSFANDGKLAVPNESAEDACLDLVNYAILAKALIIDERGIAHEFVPEPSKLPDYPGLDDELE
jgi:hypothetical protein